MAQSSESEVRRYERAGALGAVGVAGGVFLVYLVFCFLTRPQPETGGMDWTNSILTWIGTGLLALAVIAIHLAFARQLWRGEQLRP
jgi:hypothetical protein